MLNIYFKKFLFSKENGIILTIFIALFGLLTLYYLEQSRSSAINNAQSNIKEYLRNIAAIRENVSKNQKNEVYRLENSGYLYKGYFMPHILSSTYNSRETNLIYNRLREEDGLHPIMISFPSDNPRNPLNEATSKEIDILERFRKKEINEYVEVINSTNGSMLYYAIPSVPNSKNCLKCHSDPNIAPKDMVDMYGEKGGFYEREGDIRAMLATTYPLTNELALANKEFINSTAITFVVFFIFYVLIVIMILKHRKNQSILENLNRNLEKKIERRTADLKRSKDELENQKALFEALLENLPVPIFYKDRSGIYQGVNRAFEATYGINRSEIVGYTVFDIAPKDLANRYFIEDEELFKNPNVAQIYEHLVKNKRSGDIKNVLFHKMTYRDSSGSVAGIVGAVTDITEYKRLENQLNELNISLGKRVEKETSRRVQIEKEKRANELELIRQSRLAFMGEMISAITHQWQQPTTAISFSAQSLYDIDYENEEIQNEVERVVKVIVNQTEYMNETISDFRDFFKPSKKRVHFRVYDACKEVTKLFEIQLRQSRTKLDIDKEESFRAIGFPNEFKQVILIILNNSIDVFLEKEIKGEIKIEFEIGDERGKVIIEDNGGGIREELLPDKLFESYVSTKGTKGNGIGLHLAKTIIEEHMDGKIYAQNRNNGALFCVELPLAPKEQKD